MDCSKQVKSGFEELADTIMNSSTCLACHTRYPHEDDAWTCPNCGRTYKEQVECMKEVSSGL